MNGKQLIARKALKQAIGDHGAGATDPFFRGLKNEVHLPAEVLCRGQILGSAEQHRCMSVVAAGVHGAGVAGAVIEVVFLLNRKRIQIGAQPDGAVLVARPEYTHHPRGAKIAMHLDAEFFQFTGDEITGVMFFEAKFRMCMQVAAPAAHFFTQRFYLIN